MNNSIINYEETIKLGLQIVNKGDEFSEIVLKIQNTINELEYVWQGEEAKTFFDGINEEIEDMRLLAIAINEIGVLLQKVANTYQQITFDNMGN